MFTGIITDIGRIERVSEGRDARMFRIASAYDPETIATGASIAHAGCCLTVVDRGAREGGAWHDVEVSAETLARTTLGQWTEGGAVNLERSLKAGDELGGHFVAGHVDATGSLIERRAEGGSVVLALSAPAALASLLAAKGSVAVDGVSLTVNVVEGANFEVNVIPHTAEATTLGALGPGDAVNLEVDLLARYVARVLETR